MCALRKSKNKRKQQCDRVDTSAMKCKIKVNSLVKRWQFLEIVNWENAIPGIKRKIVIHTEPRFTHVLISIVWCQDLGQGFEKINNTSSDPVNLFGIQNSELPHYSCVPQIWGPPDPDNCHLSPLVTSAGGKAWPKLGSTPYPPLVPSPPFGPTTQRQLIFAEHKTSTDLFSRVLLAEYWPRPLLKLTRYPPLF